MAFEIYNILVFLVVKDSTYLDIWFISDLKISTYDILLVYIVFLKLKTQIWIWIFAPMENNIYYMISCTKLLTFDATYLIPFLSFI